MPEFKNLDALLAYAQKNIAEVTRGPVAKVVKAEYAQQAQKDVYNAHSPRQHGRRNSLTDESNMVVEPDGEMGVSIKNIAQPDASITGKGYSPSSDTQFAEWIETGAAYHENAKVLFPPWVDGEAWTKPRPFTRNTIQRLNSNKLHVKTLKVGLLARGIKTK